MFMSSQGVIPFNDLGRGTQAIRAEIDATISRVLNSGWFVLGPEHEALETELASYVGVQHAINVANGTDAIELALAAVGVASGDIVVTVANAGAYTTTAALLLGAKPVYCDVDPVTLLMTVGTLRDALAVCPEKPKAIVVTHLYGALAPIEEIVELAHSQGIKVIEDCAQSLGARLEGGQGGSFGDISTTSFYPTKNLGALGDGGAVFTNDDDLATSVRRMRQYGWSSKYSIGYAHGKNSRLDELQAAILRLKLPRLDSQNARRNEIQSAYQAASLLNFVGLRPMNESSNSHLAVILVEDRDKTIGHFSNLSIKTEIHYPIPDYKQNIPLFDPIPSELEVTQWASTRILSVPLFPELTQQEIERICASLGASH